MDRTSAPLYLVALIVAIASTPTNVYQVCRRQVGTLDVTPWLKGLSALAPARAARRLRDGLRALFQAAGGLPAVASLALVILLANLAPHGHGGLLLATAAAAPGGLNGYRQRAADLKRDIAAKSKERAGIGETAMRENRVMTAEEKAKFLALGPEVDGLAAQAAENDELLQAAEAANLADKNYRAGGQPDPDAAANAAALAAGNVPRVQLVDRTKERGFFGRQMQAVRNFAISGGAAHTDRADMELLKPMMATATGLNTDVPNEGGFLVAPERSSTIIQRAYSIGEILKRVTPMPIGPGSNGMKMPAIDETSRADNSRYGGIASGWLGQGNTLTSGKPKFRELDMKLRKVGAFVYATDEQLADAVALEAWINRYLPLELQFRVEDAFVNGLGQNQPLGVLNSPALISVTRASANHVISDDFRGLYARLWAPLRRNAVYLIDQSVEPELDSLAIPIGTAGALDTSYKPMGSMPGQLYPTYKGIPIVTVEYCAALGTSGDIVLVAFDEYMAIDKGAIEQAVSLHVAFLTDEAVFRFIYRVDGQLAWNAPLTPKSGASTLSAVLKLA